MSGSPESERGGPKAGRILTERKVWHRPRQPHERRHSSGLTAAEQENALAALRVLRVRFGTIRALARAMGAKEDTVGRAMRRRSIGPGLVLLAARAVGVEPERILQGTWLPTRRTTLLPNANRPI